MLSFVLVTALAVLPETPNDVYELVAIDLASVKPADRPYTRYLTSWPTSPSQRDSLSSATSFWANSLSWSPKLVPLQSTADGSLWRIDLRHFLWSREAWENLAGADPYFATTSKNAKGEIIRGWLDPRVEATVRKETGSTRAVLRADWFLARTSLDGPKGFFQQGFYSQFLSLPKTEKDLLAILNAKEESKLPASAKFNTLFLLRGGAVLQSQVAQHNRGLELLPTLIGADQRFIWRSLDTDSNAGDASVLESFAGTLKVAGKEFIFSLPNGLHGYYATNGQGQQVAEVPTNVAQDKGHPHDGIVYVGWKCVRCHGPSSGINGFDDVVRRLIVARKAGLATISKGYSDEEFKAKLEAYYASDLKDETERERESYAKRLKDCNGLKPDENTKNYLGWIERYLYGPVDQATVTAESGLGEEYIKLTSPSALVGTIGGESISRELFEANWAKLMQAKVWEWEEKR